MAALMHPLSILTVFTWDVLRYTLSMGVTAARVEGLVLVTGDEILSRYDVKTLT